MILYDPTPEVAITQHELMDHYIKVCTYFDIQ